MRAKYRDTKPEVCLARYKIVTNFYKEHRELRGILRRAYCFKEICEKIPIRVEKGEIIVGNQSAKYRAAALYPEYGIGWIKEEIETGLLSSRDADPYIISDEDAKYIIDTVDYWDKESLNGVVDAAIIDEFFSHASNGVMILGAHGQGGVPVGHFCTGYHNAINKGFAAIKAEAGQRMAEIIDSGAPEDTIEKYNFYRAVAIVCDGMIHLTKRYARLVEELAAQETEPSRKMELLRMADTLNRCMEKPCQNFLDAVQTLYMYQTCLCLDGNMHGISFGRVDQYLGDFYKRDTAAGELTEELGQEIIDLFYLKIAEMNKIWNYWATKASGGYSTGQLCTLGGVKKDGTDATNPVSYMMLQASGRLVLHQPPQSLRIHKDTPYELWEAAIETTKLAGGVPTFENDEVIIPALMGRGLSLESARNYCLIGCVEPAGCGDEWPACGGQGGASYVNMVNAAWLGINDGYYNMPDPFSGKTPETRQGVATGNLYDMKSMGDVLAAYRAQMEYFIKWQVININAFEYWAAQVMPLPVVSCTMDGCMESGRDVMRGGARYNSTGIAGVGLGNLADFLGIIDHCCFEKIICTTREMYDALMNNWEGFDELRDYVRGKAPHYGNAIPEADKYVGWAAKVFSDVVNTSTGPRGGYSAGLYPVTTNVMFGERTAATPDGRYKGEPLADGISPVQQMDTRGPTAVLVSAANISQIECPNGTLLNMKFHPASLRGEEGTRKLGDLLKTYFSLGGMEVQINVVSTDVLRSAQRDPGSHKDLVVRVAGFSVYFVELHAESQADLISRTALSF
jgi:formate C-acetyltransferase